EWNDGERRREATAERPARDAPGERVHAETGEERAGREEEQKVLVAEVEAGRRPAEREEGEEEDEDASLPRLGVPDERRDAHSGEDGDQIRGGEELARLVGEQHDA